MKQIIDVENWPRKDIFNFFNQFEEPFYGVCVDVDCTIAYQWAKKHHASFFLYYLYQSTAAANIIEQFKYRVEGDDVFIYDQINAGATVARDNGTFGFGYFNFYADFETFAIEAKEVIRQIKNTTELTRSPKHDLIRCSALPWIDFTSVSHARNYSVKDSCPRISFGKLTDHGDKKSMPVSIHVHHALVDGLHVGQYIDCFQKLMNQ